MKFWAIQHIPTESYLPNGTKYSGGFGCTEPTSAKPPRLFVSQTRAERSLNFWLNYQLHERQYLGESEVARKPEDMKVVVISLHAE